MNTISISEDQVVSIVRLMKEGKSSKEISEKVGLNQQMCNKIWNYYSGRITVSSDMLAIKHMNLIDRIKSSTNYDAKPTSHFNDKVKHYEISLLYGLLKIKVKPVY